MRRVDRETTSYQLQLVIHSIMIYNEKRTTNRGHKKKSNKKYVSVVKRTSQTFRCGPARGQYWSDADSIGAIPAQPRAQTGISAAQIE